MWRPYLNILILSLLFLTSCEKNYVEYTVIDTIEIKGNIDNLYNDLRELPDETYIDCSKKNIINLADGSQVEINPFIFQDKHGNVFYGEAKLLILLARKPGDFIIQKINSVAQNDVLSLGKSIYISAKADNQTLQIRNGESIVVRLSQVKQRDHQSLYYFDYQNNASWNNYNDNELQEVKWINNDNAYNGITFEMYHFSWYGAHSLSLISEHEQMIYFEVPPQYVPQNSNLFALSNHNVLIPLEWNSANSTFCLNRFSNTSKFRFVLVSTQGGNTYFSSYKQIDPSQERYILIEPLPQTKAEIDQLLNSL